MFLGKNMIGIFKKKTSLILPEKNQPVPENWHEQFILHMVSLLRPKLYVELGLYHCELFNKLEPYVDEMIGIDISNDFGKYMIKSPKAKFICTTTNEFIKSNELKNKKIDLLFIDANHSYKSVKTDFENYYKHVSDQGIILLHDGYPKNKKYTSNGYCGDGYKAIWELTKKMKNYELVTIPIHPGLTICRKRKKQVNWL